MNSTNYAKKLFSMFVLTFILSLGIITSAKAADVNGFNYGCGDILVTKNTRSSTFLGHAGIVLPDGKTVVHIAGKGCKPDTISIANWLKTYPSTKVVRCNSKTTRINASNWANDYYVNGKGRFTPYCITPNPKDLTKVYCSELVWQSYYYGANLAYKVIDYGKMGLPAVTIPRIISPYEFIDSNCQNINGFKTVKSFNW
ncbi:hypothetical protein [Clostridium botulinum]|uniref:hypothetical protein n=1 Tax=Clostridium botulinum TaxID=1491 RepID=UPI00069BFD15|nr:hypothetical protein [Clostridium botulinum]